jgi:hypothetical protein
MTPFFIPYLLVRIRTLGLLNIHIATSYRRDKLLAQAIKSYCGGMAVLQPFAWESIEFCYPSSFDTLNLACTHIQRLLVVK